MTKKCKRCKELEQIILDIHWMARRYADGRRSYAVSMFNDAVSKAVEMGLNLKLDTVVTPPTIYAKDGDFNV